MKFFWVDNILKFPKISLTTKDMRKYCKKYNFRPQTESEA